MGVLSTLQNKKINKNSLRKLLHKIEPNLMTSCNLCDTYLTYGTKGSAGMRFTWVEVYPLSSLQAVLLFKELSHNVLFYSRVQMGFGAEPQPVICCYAQQAGNSV